MEIVPEFLNCILNMIYWNFERIYFLNAFFETEINSLLRVYSMHSVLGTQEQTEIADILFISLEKEIFMPRVCISLEFLYKPATSAVYHGRPSCQTLSTNLDLFCLSSRIAMSTWQSEGHAASGHV
jgi:hypothetical protein